MSLPASTTRASMIERLGPWFHNLNLCGVRTAPDHFLGDYPALKWRQFAGAVPEDLSGRTVLDIGCNAGFYALEMKRRGAERVVGIDSDETYLAQARFAAHLLERLSMTTHAIGLQHRVRRMQRPGRPDLIARQLVGAQRFAAAIAHCAHHGYDETDSETCYEQDPRQAPF